MKLLSPVTESTWDVETNFKRRFSINVLCGIVDVMLSSPVILDDHMSGHNHLDFLQNGLPGQLQDFPLATRPLLIIPDVVRVFVKYV
jgi:hypothetical protein